MKACPLCQHHSSEAYYQDKHRNYLKCDECGLVFVPPEQHLSEQAEKAIYDQHENDASDEGYRRFLSRLSVPMMLRLPSAAEGLDFGSGPGPTLSGLFQKCGHSMSIYDIFYARDETVFERQYDFVTSTEVVEHLGEPGKELDRLWSLIKEGGWLGLMTKLVIDQQAFARWHYKNDSTHISFFSRNTFEWLGERWGSRPQFIGNDVILFEKN